MGDRSYRVEEYQQQLVVDMRGRADFGIRAGTLRPASGLGRFAEHSWRHAGLPVLLLSIRAVHTGDKVSRDSPGAASAGVGGAGAAGADPSSFFPAFASNSAFRASLPWCQSMLRRDIVVGWAGGLTCVLVLVRTARLPT